MEILKKVAQEYLKSEVTEFSVGDTVKVYARRFLSYSSAHIMLPARCMPNAS